MDFHLYSYLSIFYSIYHYFDQILQYFNSHIVVIFIFFLYFKIQMVILSHILILFAIKQFLILSFFFFYYCLCLNYELTLMNCFLQ